MKTIRFGLGLAALALSTAALTAHAASTIPSIEITGILSGSADNCSGSDPEVNVNLNNPGVEFDNYEIYNGSTLLFRWTGEHYAGVGPNEYGLQSDPFPTLPDNTTLTAIIYTFPTSSLPPTPYTSDKYSYKSQIRWNCTTGALIDIVNSVGDPGTGILATAVPVGGVAPISALLAALLGLGAWALRRNGRAVRG